MVIQPATVNDVTAICELADQINAIHHRELPDMFTDPEDTKGSEEFWLNQLEAKNSAFLVAKIQNSVVGFITAKLNENTEIPFLVSSKVCRVGTVVVSETYQNQGVGSKLMSSIENWAKKYGAKDIHLTVMEFNKNAHSFYENNGYIPTSRIMAKSIA
ncbi:MAG: GNAT family N-acetyltransferase [Pseudomonadota bacterium]